MLEKAVLDGRVAPDGRGPRTSAFRTLRRSPHTPQRLDHIKSLDRPLQSASSQNQLHGQMRRLGSEEIEEVDERLENTGNLATLQNKDSTSADRLPHIDRQA